MKVCSTNSAASLLPEIWVVPMFSPFPIVVGQESGGRLNLLAVTNSVGWKGSIGYNIVYFIELVSIKLKLWTSVLAISEIDVSYKYVASRLITEIVRRDCSLKVREQYNSDTSCSSRYPYFYSVKHCLGMYVICIGTCIYICSRYVPYHVSCVVDCFFYHSPTI